MVVEHAERYGLSQLHQLRGRVGRGVHRGLCLLVARYTPSEDAWRRLTQLAERHEALLGHARRVIPGLKTEVQTRWMGHRPSLPDSMPVIGRAPHFANAYFGFGHGHLGLTSAAVTGLRLLPHAVPT